MSRQSILTVLIVAVVGLFSQANSVAKTDPRLLRQIGNGSALAVAWSPDGRTIAIGGSLGLWLYPPDLSKPLAHFDSNDNPLSKIAWNPNGRQIATVDNAYKLQFWDTVTGAARTLAQIPANGLRCGDCYIASLSYSPDGKELASVVKGGVSLWNTANGSLITNFNSGQDAILAVAWSPDGKRLAVGGGTPAKRKDLASGKDFPGYLPLLQLWDASNGHILETFDSSEENLTEYGLLDNNVFITVSDVQWTDNGKSVAALFNLGTSIVYLWGLDPGVASSDDETQIGGSRITAMAYTSDYRTHAVIRAAIGEEIDYLTSSGGGIINVGWLSEINGMSWSTDQRYLAIAAENGVFTVDTLQPRTNKVVADFLERNADFGELALPTDGVSWSGNQLISTQIIEDTNGPGGSDPGAPTTKAIKQTDLLTGKTLKTFQRPDGNLMSDISLSPDGTRIIFMDSAYALSPQVLDTNTGLLENGLNFGVPDVPPTNSGGGPDSPTFDSSFFWNPSGNRVAVSYKHNIVVWDMRTGWYAGGVQNDEISAANWSPDGRYIAGRAGVYDPITRTDALNFNAKNIPFNAWSPIGDNFAAITQDKNILIWNVPSAKLLAKLSGTGFQWSGAGKHLAVTTDDGQVKIYNAYTWKPDVMLKTGPIRTTSFNVDSTLIATGGDNGIIDIWDVTTGKLLYSLVGHKLGVYKILWRPDSAQLLSIGDDDTMRLWNTQ